MLTGENFYVELRVYWSFPIFQANSCETRDVNLVLFPGWSHVRWTSKIFPSVPEVKRCRYSLKTFGFIAQKRSAAALSCSSSCVFPDLTERERERHKKRSRSGSPGRGDKHRSWSKDRGSRSREKRSRSRDRKSRDRRSSSRDHKKHRWKTAWLPRKDESV